MTLFHSSRDENLAAELFPSVQEAVLRSQNWFFSQQKEDGHWCAELEGDSLLQSEMIILLTFLGQENTPLAQKLGKQLIQTQGPDGGWPMYTGGEMTINNTVKAYFALKLIGHSPSCDFMQRARAAILKAGGADKVNSFTRFYLALLGQISYDFCPAVPAEMILLPKWFPVNIYSVSSWTRTIIVPLSIVSALRPCRSLPAERGIRELFIREPKDWPPLRAPGKPENPGFFSWDTFFRTLDYCLKWYQKLPWKPTRKTALQNAEKWLWEHCQNSDGPGAIQPPIMWGLVAMTALGYPENHEKVQYFYHELMKLVLENPEENTARMQPCRSPVWDTIITLRALAAGGLRADRPEISRAAQWVLDQQVLRPGDWSKTINAEPGGWCFEYHNDFYPDTDDTAMSIMALRGVCPENEKETFQADENLKNRVDTAIQKAMRWLRAMQNSDGGWGAFDRNNHMEFLTHVPFADHNAMTDPSTPDLTARILEAMGHLGIYYHSGDRWLDQSIMYLRKNQRADGSWFGRWGVNYIYGTGETLAGMAAVRVPADDPAVVAGIHWLLAHQQSCGGWGETPHTYEDISLRGTGTPTASQTAWALLPLIAFGLEHHPAVLAGIRWLIQHQNSDGSWTQKEFTGTGFPAVFYLRYHYYHQYFPLMAISRWMTKIQESSELSKHEK
ncbi:MAG: squalene--hopene cyclase [Planctomycetia bacterium]|nr:squalene--hopene cyclase [Planctomycetia bacterium]